jgi:bifunctional non-homologous end joining protein LigD
MSPTEPVSIGSRAHGGPPPGAMPSRIQPMLASAVAEPFDSADHIFELLWGGVRAMAYVRGGHVRFIGRNGCDLTPQFPELAHIANLVKAHEAIIDGEITAVDAEGVPAFEALRPRLNALVAHDVDALPPAFRKSATKKKKQAQIVFHAMDVVWLDGRSLIDRPLWQRKNRLHDSIVPGAEFCAVDFVDGEGAAFFAAVLDRRLPGIVAKLKASVYRPGERSKDWLEVRAQQSGDFVIGGYTFGGTRRKNEPFSQVLLGGFDEGRFEYVGAVSGGLTDSEAKELVHTLEPLHADVPPFIDPPRVDRFVYWTRPELVCHVRFSEWSRDGYLRFPIFSALRPDIDATDCELS